MKIVRVLGYGFFCLIVPYLLWAIIVTGMH
jgi:hypothetical protein